MKKSLITLKYLLFTASLSTGYASYALDSAGIEKQANTSISQLYHTVATMPKSSMADRIAWFSSQFKGQPYVLGSLGEGPEARYDQYPRYRVDGFDCETYVTTVLALALGNSLPSFQNCLRHTRYKDGKVAYVQRNHFTSIDWNTFNQERGILKDITLDIKDQDNKPVAMYANAIINISGWYAHKPASEIRLQQGNKAEQEKRLAELKMKGKNFKNIPSKIAYLPFTALFLKDNKPNMHLFSQIPQSAIIEIVRPNWNLHQLIGTNLNISHLGFAIWIKGQLFFRQASSQLNGVVDVPLIEYLQEARNSPTIKGINVQIVLPEEPLEQDCHVHGK